MGSPEVFVGPYVLQDTIGSGANGKVKSAFHRQTGQPVSIKIVRKSVLQKNVEVRHRVEREIKVMRLLDHPNIIRMIDVLQTNTHLFVVTELLEGGQLYEHVTQHATLSDAEVFRFFYQLITGLAFMHSQNICHRNIKLENMLLDGAGNLKIADLEIASAIPRGRYLETACGSPHYACPEIVGNKAYLGTAADVWSAGVLLYGLATNSLPFNAPTVDALYEKIQKGEFFNPPELAADLRDLLSCMLQVDGEDRISIDEVQAHPYWMNRMHLLH
eukprot:TRINITY_DN8584_c2_g1_i1.p1 TRINITY_DN8584_c2_g1~~TRINITY_DN8584_c2_g1_i1.p1  ORF type:complete len:287 (+),score=97.19 TRINITY_DN8584_c2_g1_i1:43-861(+)